MKAQINGMNIYSIDGVTTAITQLRGNIAKGFIVNGDMTMTPCYVVKQDGLFAHGETLKKAQEALLSKLFEDMPEEERIAAFIREFPTLDTVVKNQDLFEWHHRLTGSCEAGRTAFARDHGINLADSMTVADFIDLVKDQYGRNIIAEVEKRYHE